MDCPKCGHRQDDTVKCASCGVYFAKLQPASPVRLPEEPDAPRGTGIRALLATALVTATLVYALARQTDEAAPESRAAVRVQPAAVGPAPAVVAPQPHAAVRAERRVNPVEAARNATVFIRTGWGLGSGFIIDRQCRVITNRHVVETDGARVADKAIRDPEMRSRMAATQQQLVASINRDLRARRSLIGKPGTNLEQIQLAERIRAQQAQLADLPGHVGKAISAQVEGSGRSGFSVSLVDGQEFHGLHARMSERHDLAIFSLPVANCQPLAATDSRGLAIGDRLYTVGNPSGLAYTVTSGVFSGARTNGERRYLQTDAPISPGNSGGPLVNDQGEVVGINTLVMRGVPGVGFAIPIEVVYDEFPELLRPAR